VGAGSETRLNLTTGVRNRVMVGVRVRVGVWFSVFYFLSHLQPTQGVGPYKPRTDHTGRTGLNIQHSPGVRCMDYCCPFSPL